MNTPPASNPVTGVLWMIVTGLLFVGVTAVVKVLGTRVPAPEAAFLRYALGLVFLIPMLRPLMNARLTKRQYRIFTLRGVAHTAGVSLWFFAMARIPIADVTAMNYLSPVYVTLGAALFLGETLALRRILAVVAALVGALIILRPGFREIGMGHYGMLIAAVFFAVSYLTAKRMADETGAAVTVAMLSITVAIGLAPLAYMNWVTPTGWEVFLLFIVAALATAGHYTMTLALAAAPVTVTQPVGFLQLVWAVLLGALVFDEGLDVWVIVGGMVIVGAISFMTWREAVLKRRLRTPVAPATKL
ncbi:DMT family transporter [Alisedimentitalea sp. MJ-SS2]|uniref:DMT family transporter n=1 Tax=Aliisedimentitalea sp. MJ-SS2 TaxID=3049795 RepID=UPI0029130FF1|nr:DMT family transporter [Alisedimentitalea sp. MJ-SS2]MDU8926608.1 DMT family transporter [Alisedimentitalea sp. MJ-SS2]